MVLSPSVDGPAGPAGAGCRGRCALTDGGRGRVQDRQQGRGEAAGVVRPIVGFLGEHGQHDRVKLARGSRAATCAGWQAAWSCAGS